ncbi:MAG: AAA family ATPase, partial [Candidatus Nanopelagicales bacterium]
MRLHSLEISGFLAYGEQERVDFESLSDAGFFLIHGETGAGKTALLDAIAFALYGQLPGARKGVKSIRSSHAASETPTYVVLDATVGSQRLRIRRTPAYLRPKARGVGSTESKASVEVERWNGASFEPGPTSAQDANIYIRDWIGFGPDQFFRLALIPQGQFADFLHSSSKDRKELLKELFKEDHAVFGRIEDFFKNELRTADEGLRAAGVELDKQRARIAQVLGDAVEEGEVDGLAWIDARVTAAGESLEVARK